MSKYFLLSFCLMIFSCAHKPVQSNSLFEDGVTKQSLSIAFEKENFNFNGVLKKAADEINIYAYVGPGISLFKIKDRVGQPLVFTPLEARIEKKKEFFIKIYPVLKQVLLLRKDDTRWEDKKMFLKVPNFEHKIQVSYLENTVTIEDKDHFHLEITNDSTSRH